MSGLAKQTIGLVRVSEPDADFCFEHAPDPMLVLDRAGTVLRVNPAAAALLEWPAQELAGTVLLDLIHGDDAEAMTRALARLADGERIGDLRNRSRCRSGGHRWIEWHIRPADPWLIAIARDVTGRTEREAELRFRERQLCEAQRLARLGDWRWMIGSDELLWSEEIFRIFGYEPGSVQPTPRLLWDRLHPDDRALLQATMDRARADRASYDLECRILLPSGELRFVWVELHCDLSPSGLLRGLYGICQDITTQKMVEQALREAKHEAETANRSKSQFLATMSHELRTPLNAVIGFSELMMNELLGPLGNVRYADYVRAIHDSGRHLLDLINDVLDMSKIEAGKYILRPERLRIEGVIADCIRLVSGRAEEAGVRLEQVNLGGSPVIWADARAVRQILLNLLSNAIKFTQAEGMVSVTIQGSAETLILTVGDTGIGIPEAKLPLVTRPFEVVESGYDVPSRGTGLGLSITKSLVELHGGRLDIRSHLGVGTTVTVTLPRVPSLSEGEDDYFGA